MKPFIQGLLAANVALLFENLAVHDDSGWHVHALLAFVAGLMLLMSEEKR